ncbi:MAG: sulfatase-like hydrolase/transferase, partial [Muribaculaceae bacterium]|nr:sulfatase-like hydrolase/transferase [Muribaculaceae bacterium]
EYTAQALREFFDIARQQPWFDNTIFVITADHGNREWLGTKFDTGYLQYHIPFMVYTPDGSIAPGKIDDRVMSQFDIGPTVLGLLGYNRPYVSMGTDILSPAEHPHYAINKFAGTYQIMGMRYLVKWDADADRVTEVYDIIADPELTTPIATGYDPTEVSAMTGYAKAFLQDFTRRINTNTLSINQ